MLIDHIHVSLLVGLHNVSFPVLSGVCLECRHNRLKPTLYACYKSYDYAGFIIEVQLLYNYYVINCHIHSTINLTDLSDKTFTVQSVFAETLTQCCIKRSIEITLKLMKKHSWLKEKPLKL